MQQVSNLSEAKRKLLDKYLRGEFSDLQETSIPIRPKSGKQSAPLSMAQEQIWIRAQATAGLAPFYNESLTVHRNGPLDVSALERSVAEIIRRHEIWRTTFRVVDGIPAQLVHPALQSVTIPVFDLRDVPERLKESEAVRIAAEELRQPFDLKHGPLLRLRVVRLEDEKYRLYLALHQIILDGVTAYEVFFPELVSLYEAFSTGKPSALAEPPVQYSDFTSWQRQHFSEDKLAKQVAYWRQQLAGEIPELAWPRHDSVSTPSTYRGNIYPFLLPRELNEQAKSLSKQHNVTLFATLFSSFIALLHCYTGQHDLAVGTVAPAGRDRSEVQCIMGYFLNPVGIRAKLTEDTTFHDLLLRTTDSIVAALAHDDLPYEEVVRSMGSDPSQVRNPLFKVAASLEPKVPDCGSGWDLTPMDVECGGTRWDLYFVWEDRPQGITGRVQYCTELFNKETVEKLVNDFERILQRVSAAPQVPMSELSHFIKERSLEATTR
jgi:hypothetical protein